MIVRNVVTYFIFATIFAIAAPPAKADVQRRYNFCNHDSVNPLKVAYASYKLSVASTKVEGWWRAEPGKCTYFYLWDSDQYTHYFTFESAGRVIEFTPRVYEIFGIRGSGLLRKANERYCVAVNQPFEITETIFSMGRASNCRGSEILRPFGISVYGGRASEVTINVPAFSSP